MLRITTTEIDGRKKWILHGQLAGPWAAELRTSWDQAGAEGSKCVVDLTDVTFVDDGGRQVLCAMQAAGVRFIAGGVDNKHLLEDLKRKVDPPMRRCLSWLTCGDASRKDETEKR